MGNLRISVYLFIVVCMLFFTGLTVHFYYKFSQSKFESDHVKHDYGEIRQNINDKSKPIKYFLFELPQKHVELLLIAGYSKEEIIKIDEVVFRRKGNYVYKSWSKPLPISDLIHLAEYACAIAGRGCNPLLLVAIHRRELIKFVDVGDHGFYPNGSRSLVKGCESDKEKAMAIKNAKNEKERKYLKRLQERCGKERAHFDAIVKKINRYLFPLGLTPYISKAWPDVSIAGADGPMQFLSSQWEERYQEIVCAHICDMLGIKYVSPFHMLHAMVGAAAMTSDNIEFYGFLPSEVNLDDPQKVRLVAASYNAGVWMAKRYKRYRDGYGKLVLKEWIRIKKDFVVAKVESY